MFMTPLQGITDIQVFTPRGSTASAIYQTWMKPQGCSFIEIVGVSAGSGGGGGFSAASGTQRGGSAGGSSGSVGKLIIPAILVPSILYLLVGKGGTGGLAGVAGQTAGDTRVLVAPDASNVSFRLLENTGGGGGGVGTATAGGVAGSAAGGTINTFGAYGIGTIVAGQSGSAGGANGAAPNVTYPTTLFISGGVGGAGITSANVASNGSYVSFTNPTTGARLHPGATVGSLSPNNGLEGFNRGLPLTPALLLGNRPLLFSGGGGSGSFNGAAGIGGHGAWGCGGGGGGGGVTGGRGGDGGHGFVIIGAW